MLVVLGTRLFIFFLALIAPLFLLEGPAFNHISSNTFLNAWMQYDAAAYYDIAINGYNSDFMSFGNYQWWPLLPLLMKLFSFILNPVVSGFLISNIAFLGALTYLYLLVKDDFDAVTASRAVMYTALFPTSYFFSAVYTESLFLLTTVAALYYAKQSRFGVACFLGALSALTRIFGAFIVLPIGYLYLKEQGWTMKRWKSLDRRLFYFLLIPLAVGLFSYHLSLVADDPLKFLDHSQTSSRRFALPFALVVHELQMFVVASLFYKGYHTFNLVVYLSFVVAAIFAVKRLPPEYSLYLGYSVFIPTISTPIQGFTRYALVMFPAFVLLALQQKQPLVKRLTRLGLVVIVLFLAFFTFWHTRGGFAIA